MRLAFGPEPGFDGPFDRHPFDMFRHPVFRDRFLAAESHKGFCATLFVKFFEPTKTVSRIAHRLAGPLNAARLFDAFQQTRFRFDDLFPNACHRSTLLACAPKELKSQIQSCGSDIKEM